jgi:hypothetical protein
MSAVTEGLDRFLAERRLAISAMLDRMIFGDLVKVCSRPSITEDEIAAALKRHAILQLGEHAKGEAP